LVSLCFSGIMFGQMLEKGNIVGIHVRTINLDPNVSLNQYLNFYINKYIPVYEKAFPGTKLYVIKSDRVENENSFGVLFLIKSAEIRDKYWLTPDSTTVLANEALLQFQPVRDEIRKLGTATRTSLTDWIV
jgi:hypothetical protein